MIHLDNEDTDKYIRKINESIRNTLAIHAKVASLPYSGTCSPLISWGNAHSDIPIMIKLDGDYPLEYSCGIVAEIEAILCAEKEASMSSYPEIGRVEYCLKLDGFRVVIFFFPEKTCHWVETGEVETIVKKKLVCA